MHGDRARGRVHALVRPCVHAMGCLSTVQVVGSSARACTAVLWFEDHFPQPGRDSFLK